MRPSEKSVASVGYLSVVEDDVGHVGGLLMLNVQARPVEFHCTAPVKPSRAQEVLYGATLQAYVVEQIGKTLIAKSKLSPVFLATDSGEVWQSMETEVPTVFVPPVTQDSGADPTVGRRSSRIAGIAFDISGVEAFVANGRVADKSLVTEFWNEYGQGLEFCEPFERIREALAEAHGNQAGKKRVA